MLSSTSPVGQSSPSPSPFGQTNSVCGKTNSSNNPFRWPTASSPSPAFGSSMHAFGSSLTQAFRSSSSSFDGSSAFGQKQASGDFGSTPTQTSLFGSATQPSQPPFGSCKSGSSTPFGASSLPAFGSTRTPAFGATSTSAFGATSTPTFGETSSPSFGSTGSTFGMSNGPFSGGVAFRVSSCSSMFGSSNNTVRNMDRATVRSRLEAARNRKSTASVSVASEKGASRGLVSVPPPTKNVVPTRKRAHKPRSGKRSAPTASNDLPLHSDVRPAKATKGPQEGIKLSIPDESRYFEHLKEFSDVRPELNDSLWNTATNGSFLVDKFIGKEDDAKMEAAGELEVCRATISYALWVAAMGSFMETQILSREREKAMIRKELAEVGGLEGLQNLRKSVAYCRKRIDNFDLIQKDLAYDLAWTRRKLTESEESRKLVVASRDALLELQNQWLSEKEAFLAEEARLRARIIDLETEATMFLDEGFESAKAQVKVLAPELDLSPMDLCKVVRDGQIVEENAEDVVKLVVEEAGNEDSPNTIANVGVTESEATPIGASEVVPNSLVEEVEGNAPVAM